MNNIGWAITELQAGRRVRRAGGAGFLVLVPGSEIVAAPETPYAKVFGPAARVLISPHIDAYGASGSMRPGWVPSQADLLADDWESVPESVVLEPAPAVEPKP